MILINPTQIKQATIPSFGKNEITSGKKCNDEHKDNTGILPFTLIAMGIAGLGGAFAKYKYDQKWEEKMMAEADIFINDLNFRTREYKELFDYSKDMEYYFDICNYIKYPTKQERLRNLTTLNEDIKCAKEMLKKLKENKSEFLKTQPKELQDAIVIDKDFIKAAKIFRKGLHK